MRRVGGLKNIVFPKLPLKTAVFRGSLYIISFAKYSSNFIFISIIFVYSENIRRFRLSKKLTQERLAERAGITSAYISEIENQKKVGKFETIASLANALEVEPYELFLELGTVQAYNDKRTKALMNRLRNNFNELVDTIEEFLTE